MGLWAIAASVVSWGYPITFSLQVKDRNEEYSLTSTSSRNPVHSSMLCSNASWTLVIRSFCLLQFGSFRWMFILQAVNLGVIRQKTD